MCSSAPRVCNEPGGQKPVLSLALDRIAARTSRHPPTILSYFAYSGAVSPISRQKYCCSIRLTCQTETHAFCATSYIKLLLACTVIGPCFAKRFGNDGGFVNLCLKRALLLYVLLHGCLISFYIDVISIFSVVIHSYHIPLSSPTCTNLNGRHLVRRVTEITGLRSTNTEVLVRCKQVHI